MSSSRRAFGAVLLLALFAPFEISISLPALHTHASNLSVSTIRPGLLERVVPHDPDPENRPEGCLACNLSGMSIVVAGTTAVPDLQVESVSIRSATVHILASSISAASRGRAPPIPS